MKINKFSGLMRKKTPSQILEEYMLGQHGTLTDKQLEKICAKGNHRGGIAFRGKKNVRKDREINKRIIV